MTKITCYFTLHRVRNIDVKNAENSIYGPLDFKILWGTCPQILLEARAEGASHLITPLKYSCQYEYPSKNLRYAPGRYWGSSRIGDKLNELRRDKIMRTSALVWQEGYRNPCPRTLVVGRRVPALFIAPAMFFIFTVSSLSGYWNVITDPTLSNTLENLNTNGFDTWTADGSGVFFSLVLVTEFYSVTFSFGQCDHWKSYRGGGGGVGGGWGVGRWGILKLHVKFLLFKYPM